MAMADIEALVRFVDPGRCDVLVGRWSMDVAARCAVEVAFGVRRTR